MKRAVVISAAVFIGGLSLLSMASAESGSQCPGIVKQQGPPKKIKHLKRGKTVQIAPASAPPTIEMHFGTERDAESQTQTYFVRGTPVSSIRVGLLSSIREQGTGHALPTGREQLTFSVRPNSGDHRNANVRVCYDPANPDQAAPGSYQGTLQVSAPHASPQALPVLITLASDSKLWLIVFVAVGSIGAWAARAGADAQRGPGDLSWDNFAQALIRLRSIVALLFGLGAGIYAAFKLSSPADSTYDGTFLAAVPVLGAAFAGTLGTKTVADLFPPSKKEIGMDLAGGVPEEVQTPQPRKETGTEEDDSASDPDVARGSASGTTQKT